MAALRLSDQLRKRLNTLLADDRCDSAWVMNQLREIRDTDDAPAHAAALHALAHIEIPEVQAERLLEELMRHRSEVTRALGRDPGLRVAVVDYLSNFKKLLANPTIVESSHLERTERSAITDPLTRLYNRRFFGRALALETRRGHRYSLRLSLLMLDVDGFKRLNDRHGHLFGDLVLQRVGHVLSRAVRDADSPCRYGGEEFTVILPETDRLGAYAVAERIRQRIRHSFTDKPVGGRRVEVSLSGGIASYPVDGEDPPALIARADQALYLAKRQGKNRISLYHSERRGAIRYPARAGSRVNLQALPCGTPTRVRPLNLSRQGALLDVGDDLHASAPVEMTFDGSDATGRPRSWVTVARVVRVDRPARGGRRGRVAVVFDEPLSEDCLFQQVQRNSTLPVVQAERA